MSKSKKAKLKRIVAQQMKRRLSKITDGLTAKNKHRVNRLMKKFRRPIYPEIPMTDSFLHAFLAQFQKKCFANSKAKGFWDKKVPVGDLCALLHTEVSEAYEEWRRPGKFDASEIRIENGKPEGFGVELADVFIRLLVTAEGLGVDLGTAVAVKMAYNATRERLHGGKKS